MAPRSRGMWEGGCSPCQQHHFEARRACGARLTSPTRWWWDLGTPLPCSRPAAGGRCVKPSRCIRRANPARRRCEKITRSVLKTASSCCFLNGGKHQSPSNPAPRSCTAFPAPCSRTAFPHHVPCATLPHHALVPHSHTALPPHVPTPHSHTALPHHVLAPRSCTAFLHRAPAPRSHVTLLHHVLAACSCTAFPHRTPLPDSHTALPRHVPAARSQTPFPHRILAPRSCHRAPTSRSSTPFPHRARSRTMFLHHAPAPDSCGTLPNCGPAYAYTAFLPPHSRTALPHSRHSPKTVPCCHPGPVPVFRGRAAAPRPRQEPSPPTTSSPAEDPEPVGRSPSPWGTWRGGTWGMPVEVQALGSGRGC